MSTYTNPIDSQKITEQVNELHVELWYPRHRRAKSIRVGLMDVRAASDLVIRYDFDRDGWAISMDETVDRGSWMETIRENVEVAFIPAWNEATPEGTST